MGGGNFIPFLSKFYDVNFSSNSHFGGHFQAGHTQFTIGGTVGYLCALSLYPSISNTVAILQKNFLKHANCISDILARFNYNQHAILGYEADFAGSGNFFLSHNISIFQASDFAAKFGENKELKGFWGFKDSVIFSQARDFLAHAKEPFALYIPTADTHAPNGQVDSSICPNLESSHANAILCSDSIIFDFISWVRAQKFYKNTTIVILGDHLFPAPISLHERRIYNAFINPQFSHFDINKTKNRALSHFDFGALILDSLGSEVRAFGLGRNPFYDKTLIEQFGFDVVDSQSKLNSALYASFWAD